MKECSRCKKRKLKEYFYKNKFKKDGYDYYCKKCRDIVVNKYHKDTSYFSTEKYRLKMRINGKNSYKKRKERLNIYREKNSIKIKARAAVCQALKSGELIKMPCIECKEVKVHAHHHLGYERENWLNIKWLCEKHHNFEHKK